jgi:hypothetical protein
MSSKHGTARSGGVLASDAVSAATTVPLIRISHISKAVAGASDSGRTLVARSRSATSCCNHKTVVQQFPTAELAGSVTL